MAALLVGMSVMAVLLGALLPQWTTLATREKEQELVFRGNQYARAIGLFQRKFANAAPPTLDVLVEQRFLRKKYKDPMTNGDFQPIYASQAPQGGNAPAANRPGQQATARPSSPGQQTPQPGSGNAGATSGVGIIGVSSKSTETSLKLYNGRDKYSEWAFVYVQPVQRPQGPGQGVQPGAGGPQRPGQQPGQQQRPGVPGGGQLNPFSPSASQPNRPPVPAPVRPPGH